MQTQLLVDSLIEFALLISKSKSFCFVAKRVVLRIIIFFISSVRFSGSFTIVVLTVLISAVFPIALCVHICTHTVYYVYAAFSQRLFSRNVSNGNELLLKTAIRFSQTEIPAMTIPNVVSFYIPAFSHRPKITCAAYDIKLRRVLIYCRIVPDSL